MSAMNTLGDYLAQRLSVLGRTWAEADVFGPGRAVILRLSRIDDYSVADGDRGNVTV